MIYRLTADTALSCEGLFDYCESLNIVFDQFFVNIYGDKKYYAWIESDTVTFIVLKFPDLGFKNIPKNEE